MRKVFLRYISILVAFIFILSSVSAAYAAEPGVRNTEKYSDIYGSEYKSSIALVTDLGIFPDASGDKFKPYDTVTRGDIAYALAKCMGIGEAAPVETKFSDVGKGIKTSGYINAVSEYLNGLEDGTFKPGEAATYNQVLQIFIRALGYNYLVEEKGGYPSGLNIAASRIGLSKGTYPQDEQPISRENAAKIIDNALHIDILQPESIGEYIEYKAVEGENMMTKFMGLKEVKGQITADSVTAIRGRIDVSEGNVMIGSLMCEVGETNAEDLLGYYVRAIVTDDSRTERRPVIKSVCVDETRCSEVFVSSEDVSDSTTINSFVYYDETRDKENIRISIKDNADLIYNGAAMPSWTAEDLKPKNGWVKLIDTDGDKNYDTIFVRDYINLVVGSTSKVNNTIFTVYEDGTSEYKSVDIDPKDKNKKVVFRDMDGNDVGIEKIEKWMILSLAESKDKTVTQIIVSSKSVNGKIEQISEDKIKIGDKWYRADSRFFDRVNKGVFSNVKAGQTGTVYLDAQERIAAFDTSGNREKQYGYLIESCCVGALAQIPRFKIFTEQSEVKVFEAKDKIVFNDTSTPAEDVQKALDNNNQLIEYKINEDEKITLINTAMPAPTIQEQWAITDPNDEYGERDSKFSLDIDVKNDAENGYPKSLTYRAGSKRMFGGKIRVGDSTKTFVIPSDLSRYDLYDIKDVTYWEDYGSYTDIKFYDISKEKVPAAIVLTDDGRYSMAENIGVVDQVVEAVNGEGTASLGISMIVKNTKATYLVSDNENVKALLKDTRGVRCALSTEKEDSIEVTDLKRGDVIQYMLSPKSEIIGIRVLFRCNTPEESEKEYWGNYGSAFDCYSGLYYSYGEVTGVYEYGVLIRTKNTNSPREDKYVERVIPYTSLVILYDSNRQRVDVTDATDILRGDKILVNASNLNTILFVVYR